MIRIITGTPGAGKSYFAVYELVRLYFKYDASIYRYIPRSKKTLIISNVDSLKLDGVYSLDGLLKRYDVDVNTFFTVDFQNRLKIDFKVEKIVYFIDEAQRLWPRLFKDNDVLFLFQYHRHIPCDFYLMTQDVKLICPAVSALCEFLISAVRPSLRFRSIFRYHVIAGGEKIDAITLKPDKRIFALYKSFEGVSDVAGRSVSGMRRYFIMGLLLVLGVVLSFLWFLRSFSLGGDKGSHSSLAKKEVSRGGAKKAVRAYLANRIVTSRSAVGILPSSRLQKVWVRIGSVVDSGVISDGQNVFFLFMGKVYSSQSFPYPVIKDKSGFYALIPASMMEAQYRYFDFLRKSEDKEHSPEVSTPACLSAHAGRVRQPKRAQASEGRQSEGEASEQRERAKPNNSENAL